MLDIFRAGGDPYAAFGAQMFNIPGMTKESHPDLRQSAKSALLGCGYGLGWASFASQLLVGFLGAPPVRYSRKFARQLGVDQKLAQEFLEWRTTEATLLDIPHTCSIEELVHHAIAAKRIIDIYRSTAYQVVSFWNTCSSLLESALYGGVEAKYKCLTFRKEAIELPNGMVLKYPNLRIQKDDKGRDQFVYGADATKLYAGKITNNVTQALARVVMTDGMLRVSKRYKIVGTVHDELIAVVPDAEVEFAKTWVLAQMTMEPRYLPGIPLDADGGAHRRYGLAKG
jgi:DNA polymerase